MADVYAAASRAAATGMRGLASVPVPPPAGRDAAANRAARRRAVLPQIAEAGTGRLLG